MKKAVKGYFDILGDLLNESDYEEKSDGAGRSVEDVALDNAGSEKPDKKDGSQGASVPIGALFVVATHDEEAMLYRAFELDGDSLSTVVERIRDYGFAYRRLDLGYCNAAVVVQENMGCIAACSIVTRAIVALRPKIVIMTGICAGNGQKLELGSVAIANTVLDYSAGKLVDGAFLPRPRVANADAAMIQYVNGEVASISVSQEIERAWKGLTRRSIPSISCVPFVCGSLVMNDAAAMASIRERQNDFGAVDMESYGLAYAAQALNCKWLVVKGVQDYGDGNKESDELGFRDFAAFSSAKLVEIILPAIVSDLLSPVGVSA